MIWRILIFLAMTAVILAAFLTEPPMDPAVSLGDADLYRIFYFHVPLGWISALAFIVALIHSVRYLKTKQLRHDLKATAAARLGLVFAILATVTGSVFAKMTWGEFWNWYEVREVSILILLIIYGAYFALRSALADIETRASFSAVLAILFGLSAVFLIFILPRLLASFSQHPTDSIVDSGGRITMDSQVAAIFTGSLIAFTMLFIWLYRLSVRVFGIRGDYPEERY